jgi:zinc protease
VLALAGDFDTGEMMELVHKYYDAIPSGKANPHVPEPEGQADGEKRVDVSGPGETTYLQLSYRAPAASNSDFFVMSVLDSLLTGPSSLNMFGGGGISNKTSRLYRELVEKEFAISIFGGLQATIDPYLYTMSITVRPDRKAADVLKQLDQEIEKLQQKPVSQAEIDRAIKQARALFAYGSENITNQAFWLGYAEMFDKYAWFTNYVEVLNRVTPQQVQQAAQDYFNPSKRVVGVYTPEEVR